MSFKPGFASAPPRRDDRAKAAAALQQAVARHQMGDFPEAARLYKVVLRKFPDQVDALHHLGLLEAQRERFDKAETLLRKAVGLDPHIAEANANFGNVLRELGKFDEALSAFDRALQLRPQYPNALNGRGTVLLALGRAQDALASFEAALTLDPGFAGALGNKGAALLRLNRPEEALASYDRALSLEPQAANLHAERAGILVALGRIDAALAAFDLALKLDPQAADVHYNCGVALLHAERFADALASFDAALARQPRFAPALRNRGNVLVQLGRLDEALASFDAAVTINPDDADTLSDEGHAALAGSRHELAAECFARLVARHPDHPYAIGNLLYARAHCCDWRDFAQNRAALDAAIKAGKPAVFPGHLLALSDSPENQLTAARRFVSETYPPPAAPPPTLQPHGHERIRLAYVSANFNDHAMPMLLAALFEQHDRSRFETTAISFAIDDGSPMRKRLTAAFDHFVDARRLGDDEIVALLRARETDIAVDLMGFTQGARPNLFNLRPAPIQVSYMGYPGTTALPGLDYVLADACVIPEHRRACFTEQVVWLPDTYYGNDNTRPIADRLFTRAECGLPEQGFVFCCFNAHHKITPDVFAIWMRLLTNVEGSVLWLLKPNAAAQKNLLAAAQAHGIAPRRLIFGERLPADEHLARHRPADLFLDTLPYNAHTTACDALWAGVPVLTCTGESFPARVAASILHALGLPELITTNAADYESLALALARDPARLAALRAKVAAHRGSYPLFDTDRFRHHMEAAYETMWERHRRGDAPAGFAVPTVDRSA